MRIRQPAVAGSFYPADPHRLTAMVKQCLDDEKERIDYTLASKEIIGGVVPHAGFMYSGVVAVHFYEIVYQCGHTFDTVIILNPNHTGYGMGEVIVDCNKYWETPLGKVQVDVDFVRELHLPADDRTHELEHSGEVQIPFLQIFLQEGFQILPIALNHQSAEVSLRVARAIFEANKKLGKKILLVASSDFSHYVSPQVGNKMDELVLESIMKLDVQGIDRVVKQHHISVCGYGPIMTLVEYARLVSSTPYAKILRRGHSGEHSPSETVVDYVSILFSH